MIISYYATLWVAEHGSKKTYENIDLKEVEALRKHAGDVCREAGMHYSAKPNGARNRFVQPTAVHKECVRKEFERPLLSPEPAGLSGLRTRMNNIE